MQNLQQNSGSAMTASGIEMAQDRQIKMGRVPPLQKNQQSPQSLSNMVPQIQISSESRQGTPQMGSKQNSNLQTQESQTYLMDQQRQQAMTTPFMMQPQQQQQTMVIHETFSIPMLERKMMFLNEPGLQYNQGGQAANEQIRQLWRIHYKQMSNMRDEGDSPEKAAEKVKTSESVVPKRPDSIDEIGGQLGFSTPSQRPRDFNQFQNAVRNNLNELTRAHRDLRTRFKQAGTEVDKDIQRIEQLTEHIQQVFNDFALCFNSFVQREERLETLHHQAIKKSKELSKKIQLEVMAQSSQRSQLLAIVDDLTNQLRETKASTVKTSALKNEHLAHQATRELVENKQKQIEAMEQEIKALNGSLQSLGQTNVLHKGEKGQLEEQINHLNGVVADLNNHIDDLIQRRSQLEQEVSRLKSQIELTQSSKDKIILKLKQEMRMNAVSTPANMNGTLGGPGTLNNTLMHNVNMSTNYLNSSQAAAAITAGKQIHQFPNQVQFRQQQQQQQQQTIINNNNPQQLSQNMNNGQRQ